MPNSTKVDVYGLRPAPSGRSHAAHDPSLFKFKYIIFYQPYKYSCVIHLAITNQQHFHHKLSRWSCNTSSNIKCKRSPSIFFFFFFFFRTSLDISDMHLWHASLRERPIVVPHYHLVRWSSPSQSPWTQLVIHTTCDALTSFNDFPYTQTVFFLPDLTQTKGKSSGFYDTS